MNVTHSNFAFMEIVVFLTFMHNIAFLSCVQLLANDLALFPSKESSNLPNLHRTSRFHTRNCHVRHAHKIGSSVLFSASRLLYSYVAFVARADESRNHFQGRSTSSICVQRLT